LAQAGICLTPDFSLLSSAKMAPKQRLPRGILPDGIDVPPGTDIMQFCRDLAESGAQFAEQFERDNPNFHGGWAKEVPMGGSRVPESMPEAYGANWRELPEAPLSLEDDHGEEYHKWMEMHTRLNTCKRAITVVNKPVEVAYKLRLQYNDAEGDDRTALEGRLKGAENDRDGALEAATAIIFDMDPEIVPERCRKVVQDVKDQGKFEFADMETYGEFIQLLKRANQEIFLVQRSLLQKIKDAKKAFKNRYVAPADVKPSEAEAAKANGGYADSQAPEVLEAADGGA